MTVTILALQREHDSPESLKVKLNNADQEKYLTRQTGNLLDSGCTARPKQVPSTSPDYSAKGAKTQRSQDSLGRYIPEFYDGCSALHRFLLLSDFLRYCRVVVFYIMVLRGDIAVKMATEKEMLRKTLTLRKGKRRV
jgi:hypothetical protein